MAAKPTPGGSDGTYGTELNEFLDVAHDADGTHTKSQMLTDLEYSPTAYAGEESVTFPNGYIIKTGEVVTGDNDGTVTFGAAFPNGIISIHVSLNFTNSNAASATYERGVGGAALTTFDWHQPDNGLGISWTVKGH